MVTQTRVVTESREISDEAPPLVRWGAVFSGTIIGLALMLLAGSLWVALAFGSHRPQFYNHLAWWLAGTAIAAMFVAALIAGAVSGTRGRGAGFLTGLTTWALVVLAAIAAGVPGVAAYGSSRPINVNGVHIAVATVRPWTTFWALLIGLGAAIIGGVIGGTMPRRKASERVVDVREPAVAERPIATEPLPTEAAPAETTRTRTHARR